MTDLRALLNNATPPPWEIDDGSIVCNSHAVDDPYVVERVTAIPGWQHDRPSEADAALIVALVNQAHTLLDRLEQLEAVAEALTAEISPGYGTLMQSLAFYCGPNARTAVSRDTEQAYLRLRAALSRLDQKQTP